MSSMIASQNRLSLTEDHDVYGGWGYSFHVAGPRFAGNAGPEKRKNETTELDHWRRRREDPRHDTDDVCVVATWKQAAARAEHEQEDDASPKTVDRPMHRIRLVMTLLSRGFGSSWR